MRQSTVAFIHDEDSVPAEKVVDFMQEDYILEHHIPAKDIKVGELSQAQLAYIMTRVMKEFHATPTPVSSGNSDINDHKNPVSSVLGTTGNVLHGVVDVAEGFLRGIVDVATLGKARR